MNPLDLLDLTTTSRRRSSPSASGSRRWAAERRRRRASPSCTSAGSGIGRWRASSATSGPGHAPGGLRLPGRQRRPVRAGLHRARGRRQRAAHVRVRAGLARDEGDPRFGSEEQKERWLPELAGGEAVGCFGLTEPSAGSRPVEHADHRAAGGRRLGPRRRQALDRHGLASPTSRSSGRAPRTACAASSSSAGRPASRRGHHRQAVLRASLQSELRFDGVRLGEDALLPGARGLRGPFTCLAEARYGIVWGVTGAARDCLARALEHAGEREQFGRPSPPSSSPRPS